MPLLKWGKYCLFHHVSQTALIPTANVCLGSVADSRASGEEAIFCGLQAELQHFLSARTVTCTSGELPILNYMSVGGKELTNCSLRVATKQYIGVEYNSLCSLLLFSLCGKFCFCECAQYAKPKMSGFFQGLLIQVVILVLQKNLQRRPYMVSTDFSLKVVWLCCSS